jgi:undecaprenyl diphosphate synthase
MAFKPTFVTEEQKKSSSEKLSQQFADTSQSDLVTLEEERIYREGVVNIRDLIAPSAFKVENNFIQLGTVFCRTIFLSAYPRYISVGWSSPIINMSVTMDISMFFYPVKSSIILKQLKNKTGALEAQINSDHDKGAPRDPLRETALHDVEKLRDDLTQGTEHFFQFAFYVTVYAESKEKLDQISEDVESIFGSKLISSRKVLFQSEQGFNSTLPMCNDELVISFNMNSSPIAASFPFISSELTSDDGILYGINRHNNSLILFERFSLQNANMVVFATAGAGKSYAIKLEILRSLMMGGNRRWARQRGLRDIEGHKKAVDAIKPLIKRAVKYGIKSITFWIFSTENIKRDEAFLEDIFSLARQHLSNRGLFGEITDMGGKVKLVGNLGIFPKDIAKMAADYVAQSNPKSHLIDVVMAFGYGGRDDVVRAVKNMIKDKLTENEITEPLLQKYLDFKEDVDLVIRTSGRYRTSGLYIWQAAYSELYFTDTLCPDFNEAEFDKAIKEFTHRVRTFGR